MASLRALVADAARTLAAAGVPSPEHDARALAAHALGVDRLPVGEDDAPAGFADSFAALVARRAAREPLQHLTGWAAFRYLTLTVRPGVFVPRPETEVVAGVAIEEAAALVVSGDEPVVVDLCTGSGAIAVAVATEVTAASVTAVDLSDDAVALAAHNAERAGARLDVLRGDVADPSLLARLEGAVAVLVSNPPYIPPGAVPVDPEVRDHDPHLALFGGGDDGLETPRAVLAAAARLLRPGGLLVMEHADVQGADARALAAATGAFTAIETRQDLTGRDRMLVARRR